MSILKLLEGQQPKYKNNFLEEHGQHFINAGISTIILYQFGMIEKEQLYNFYISSVTIDFIIKHNKQIIKFVMPNLFIM